MTNEFSLSRQWQRPCFYLYIATEMTTELSLPRQGQADGDSQDDFYPCIATAITTEFSSSNGTAVAWQRQLVHPQCHGHDPRSPVATAAQCFVVAHYCVVSERSLVSFARRARDFESPPTSDRDDRPLSSRLPAGTLPAHKEGHCRAERQAPVFFVGAR